ncbi:MAG TPA: NADH-quinone oxidoreductase subunit J, partial [Rhodanobacter sp.]
MNPQLFQLICFYAFGFVTVAAALSVITLKNTVHAVLALVLTFFSAACLWMLLDAEFLALALIVVYVGAVMVLFLFVVMMLDIDQEKMREGFVKFLPVGLIVAAAMLAEMLGLIGVRTMHLQVMGPDPAAAAGTSNTAWLGHALYTQYLLPFEVAALILTVGVVAAVALTLRQRADA